MTAAKQFVEGGPVPQGKVDRNAALAVRIATQLGLPVEPLETLRAGSVNQTFVVGYDAERCVIRFAVDPLRVDEFVTEAWCMRLAAAHGIASPAVVAVGTLEGVPYAVHRFVPHVAQDAAGGRHVWETLGRYARTIHGLPISDDAPDGLFTRFGRDLAPAWQAHLAFNLAELTPADRLIALGSTRLSISRD